MTLRKVEVAIVGAGPVGATLACLLARGGIATAVLDRAALPPMELPEFDGRAYAIAATSRNLLEAAGVWARLPERAAQPITRIRVADGKIGRPASGTRLDFHAAEVDEPAFGWMVEARHLRIALNARLPSLPHVEVFAPATLVSVVRDEGGAVLTLADGTVIEARLVVAAEGRESPLREAAAIRTTRHPYGQAGIVAAIEHAAPHQGTAVELFLPAGPFAVLPLPDGEAGQHRSAVVWTERQAEAERLFRADPSVFAQALARRFQGMFGDGKPVGQRWLYPLSAMHAEAAVSTRLALVGDALHGIHPIAGQGLNLGFRDVAALAELLLEANTAGSDPGEAVLGRRYQAARRGDNLLMLGATHFLEGLFSNDFGPLRLARGLGLAAVGRVPGLKQRFIRRAMGVAPGAPGLLAGRPVHQPAGP